jgi:hypothetical protein
MNGIPENFDYVNGQPMAKVARSGEAGSGVMAGLTPLGAPPPGPGAGAYTRSR